MRYKFVGDGAGVPGLPHEITDDEAEALGVTELLKAAVENGNYQPADEPKPAARVKAKKAEGVNDVQ